MYAKRSTEFHVNFWAQRKSYRRAHSVLLLSEDQYRARVKEILKSSHTFWKSGGGTAGKRVFVRDFPRGTADSTALAGYRAFYPGKLPLWPYTTTRTTRMCRKFCASSRSVGENWREKFTLCATCLNGLLRVPQASSCSKVCSYEVQGTSYALIILFWSVITSVDRQNWWMFMNI